MGQNETKPEAAGDLQVEKAEVKKDSGNWVFEEDIIDVFDDDEVGSYVKADGPESNVDEYRPESLRSDSGFGDVEDEIEICSEGDDEAGGLEIIDMRTSPGLSLPEMTPDQLFRCDHVQMVARTKRNPVGSKSKRCKFKGSSVEILRKHKDFFHSDALKKDEVERKENDSENMFPCSDCVLVFSHEWKLRVSEIGVNTATIFFR